MIMPALSPMEAEQLKAQVRDFWNHNPCGLKFANVEFGTREFFDAIEAHRYTTEGHIKEVVDFPRWKDKKVLEIGCGLGTDALQFARAGADYLGVDLTETAAQTTERRLRMYGVPGRTQVADAERLPFADNTFDLVYSHGVLHHTPDTEQAIREVHRVLRPGGTAMVMLYHRNSYNYYGNILFFRRLGAQLFRFSWGPKLANLLTGEDLDRLKELQHRMKQDPKRFFSTEEFLNQNTDGVGNPLARVYSRAEVLRIFSMFSQAETQVHFLNKRWLPLIGPLLPRFIELPLAHRIGWHLWIIGKK